MSLWRMAYRQLLASPRLLVATCATLVATTALVLVMGVMSEELDRSLKQEAGYCDLVVGAPGSPLQSVLSSIYHIDQPTGNIPTEVLAKVRGDVRVAGAAPLSLGDNYKGYRIVGTDLSFFELSGVDKNERLMNLEKGSLFSEPFEAVLGSRAASGLGLNIGSTFAGRHEAFKYKVVGILKPSNTSQDRGVFVSQESVWLVHQKELSSHAVFSPVQRKSTNQASDEITAILVQLKSAGSRFWVAESLRKDASLSVASPLEEILKLTQSFVKPIIALFKWIAWLITLIVAVSLATLMALILKQQSRDFGIARCLGASPKDLYVLQAYLVGWRLLIGLLGGLVLGYGVLSVMALLINQQTGLYLNVWVFPSSVRWHLFLVNAVSALVIAVPLVLMLRKEATRMLNA